MDRWTIKEINETDDFRFAAAILVERRSKITPYSPLGQKLDHAIRTLIDASDKLAIENARKESKTNE